MNNLIIINIGVLIVIMVGVFFLFRNQSRQMEDKFSRISQDVLKTSSEQFLLLANQRLEKEHAQAQSDLELKKQAVEDAVKGLKEELEKYKDLMHQFEKDRDTKYGNLANELKNTSLTTTKLQETTNLLTNILGSNQERGQWGERMAEDIIERCGLVEGMNYKKQKKDAGGTKPDFTFFLPDKHKVHMDVKFPFANYEKMLSADDQTVKERFKEEFLKDTKKRIKEIQNRAYINPTEGTLDFVLLFIPNEQVYGFVQENSPGLIDEALKQKVVLCSPFTLYAMLSVIRQAFENFHYEKATTEIIKRIELFAKAYTTFKGRFEDIEDTILKLEKQYNQLRTTSFKELDTKIRRINDYKKGNVNSLENVGETVELIEKPPSAENI